MKTTYLTTIQASFNAFLPSSKVPRLFLAQLPANAHKTIKITATQQPRGSLAPATLEIGLKDGQALTYAWTNERAAAAPGSGEVKKKRVTLSDIVDEVNRHARVVGRKEELAG